MFFGVGGLHRKSQILLPKLKEVPPKIKDVFLKLKNLADPFVGDGQKLVRHRLFVEFEVFDFGLKHNSSPQLGSR